ncbi:response regulator [Coleofasciculus sp. FACHB-1120]|uniref:response regulator n=1 Tax=Coleofasciculus sp. FACHB-1120 TaxID=2692783 RepID=UPI001685F6EE|nr:response regulator [Coleofasciculus sp. FACHB-1120]MBD2741733.1 response regulator [Coleofasciculus sp. FACHB-1120]
MDDLELSHRNSQNFLSSSNSCLTTKLPLVLAVDDDEDNLLLLSYVLEPLNCSIITAVDGHTAFEKARTEQPSLILLDIMLPDLDGLQIVRQLREDSHTRTIPVIAVTALARPEDRERILAAGCNDYISKPYLLEDLEAVIRRNLRWNLSQVAPVEFRMDCAS